MQVGLRGVSLVGADLARVEAFDGGVEQGDELLAVGPALVDRRCRHDIGERAGHGVELDELLALDLLTPLVVVPACVTAGGEPGRVLGDVLLNDCQRRSRDANEFLQA